MIKLFFFKTENRFEIEASIIKEFNPEWNKAKGKSIQRTKK